MKENIVTLWRAFRRYRWHVALLVIFGILSPLLEAIGINAAIPLMSFFMGGAGAPTDIVMGTVHSIFSFLNIPFTFRYLLAFILLLFIVRSVSVIVFGYIRGWISADFLGKESEEVMRRALLASWAYSLKQKIGTMHNTLVRDVHQTGNLLSALVQVIQSFSGFLMYLLIAVNISPTMTLYAVGGGAALLILLRPLLLKTQRIGEQTAGVEKQFAQFLSEHIIGMKSIKASGVERSAIKNGVSHIRLLRHLSIRQSLVGTVSTSFFQPFSIVLVAILFLLTYKTPEFSIIAFAASLYLIQKIFTYLESGHNAMQSVSALLPYAKNIGEFKQTLDKHREPSGGERAFDFTKELTFSNVSFSYEKGTEILNGITFTIRPGETVGLVGPSGAGKTSIADLLLRLFTPTSGTISLDGVPVEEIGLQEWRARIGYVSQDVFLLNGTIEENIRFYDQSLTSEQIELATKQANIYDYIKSLPDGFQTVTGDRGVMLSGGQRQRIALARALVKEPAILILDEATSALDHESERLIHESIRSLHGKVTVVVIAHRPSTVAEADSIIVLERGKITESGSPSELLGNTSSYFYKMQKV